MIPIRPQGRFFRMDAQGKVLNDTAWAQIPTHYQAVLAEIIRCYQSELTTDLHSIYIRGSLPRGLYAAGISDIDTFALVHRPNIRWERAEWADTAQRALQGQFSQIGEVEWMLSTYSTQLAQIYPALAMQIKTQSLCLYGIDVLPTLPDYSPGPKMVLYAPWLSDDWRHFEALEDISVKEVQQICKTIIRTGFELVMERLGRFSPDLYVCYREFSTYYPHFEAQMRQLLSYYLNPQVLKAQIQTECRELIPFLEEELIRWTNFNSNIL